MPLGSTGAVGKPTQRPAQAGKQLAHGEGLGEVVVRLGVQRTDLVGVLRTGAHHDDGRLRPTPDVAHHLNAVDVGQPQVEQDHVGRVGGGAYDGSPARGGHDVPVAMRLERRNDEVADGGIVLHHKNRRFVGRRHRTSS